MHEMSLLDLILILEKAIDLELLNIHGVLKSDLEIEALIAQSRKTNTSSINRRHKTN